MLIFRWKYTARSLRSHTSTFFCFVYFFRQNTNNGGVVFLLALTKAFVILKICLQTSRNRKLRDKCQPFWYSTSRCRKHAGILPIFFLYKSVGLSRYFPAHWFLKQLALITRAQRRRALLAIITYKVYF